MTRIERIILRQQISAARKRLLALDARNGSCHDVPEPRYPGDWIPQCRPVGFLFDRTKPVTVRGRSGWL